MSRTKSSEECIAEVEADRDRLRALLVWAYRWVPAVSDVEAVSRDEVEAGRNMIDDELSALPPTGQHEHPDTVSLDLLVSLADNPDYAGLVITKVRSGTLWIVCRRLIDGHIRRITEGPDLRSAIDALKEEEKENA